MLRPWHTLFHFIITPPVGGQREQQRLGEGKPPAPSHPASTGQNQSPHPSPQCLDGDCHCRISHSQKSSSPLIAAFITQEAAAWEEGRLPDCRGQGLSRRRALGGPPASRATHCYFHLSDFSDSSCCLQPRQQSDPYSRTGQSRSCPGLLRPP